MGNWKNLPQPEELTKPPPSLNEKTIYRKKVASPKIGSGIKSLI
jgi:hypothetical protein